MATAKRSRGHTSTRSRGGFGRAVLMPANLRIIDRLSAKPLSAYSLRKVRDAYGGAAIRVRRSNDNAEQDIGFTSLGELDESALTAFTGANNGFVKTWYDQSGNGRNATQATTTTQPRIVNAGVVDKKNTRPVVVFDGTDDFLDGTTSLTGTTATASAVSYMLSGVTPSPNGYCRLVSASSSSAANDYDSALRGALILRNNNTAAWAAFRASGLKSSKAVVYDQLAVVVSIFDGTNHTMRVDQSAAASVASTGTFGSTFLRVGGTTPTAADGRFIGGVSSVMVWDSALSGADLSTLESDLKTYFGTP